MHIALVAITLLYAAPASSQEVSVPAVTTASPGGYANPLKLDTDKYRHDRKRQPPRKATPFGACNQQPLTEAKRRELEAGYLSWAKGNAMAGWRWVKNQCGATAAQSIERSAKRRAAGR